MAHGAFFTADQSRLESVLGSLSQALHHLGEDLMTTGQETRIYCALAGMLGGL